MILGESEQQREEREVNRSIQLRQDLKDRVFTDESGVKQPHIGFGYCQHGNPVYGCKICRGEK